MDIIQRVKIMTPEQITDIIRQTLFVAVEISAPILVITLILGLSISVFQSVTHITETTLIFIPKIFTFTITFGICFPWMLKIMTKYTYEILITHWNNLYTYANYAM